MQLSPADKSELRVTAVQYPPLSPSIVGNKIFEPLRLFILACLCAMPTVAFALNDYQPYTLPTDDPQSYQQIRDVFDEDDPFADPKKNIPMNLQEAMCGGWDFTRELNGVYQNPQAESTCPPAEDEPIGAQCEDTGSKIWTKTRDDQWTAAGAAPISNAQMNARAKKTDNGEGLIAKVTGVPGRNAKQALGNIHAGLAVREERYIFPTEDDQVCGFATACRINGGRPNERDNPPFFCSHPCQRPLGGIIPKIDPGDTGPKQCGEQEPQNPNNGIKYSCGGEAMNKNVCGALLDGGVNGGLCRHLNTMWLYTLYKNDDTGHVMKGPCGGPADPARNQFRMAAENAGYEKTGADRYCCTDAEITSADKNCITCEGEECKDGRTAKTILAPEDWQEENWPEQQEREYVSFFRAYPQAGYERKEFGNLVEDDQNKKENIPVACYGIYDDAPEDAKRQQISAADKRCVIAPYGAFDDMHKTQRGKGVFDPEVEDDAFPNDPKRPFNVDQSLWYNRITNSFSLLNDKVFSGKFNGDFSFALLATDSAKQRVTVQLDQERPLSRGALIRTPDDTITDDDDFTKDRRTVVEWWHRIETEMHKNLTPPKVTLLLPTPWSVDLDPLDPLFTPKVVVPDQPSPEAMGIDTPVSLKPDIRNETIEVQVQAREDLLGELTSLLKRQLLLRIEEEPVPIVVPIVNPGEMRAYAEGWEAWAYNQEELGEPGADRARVVAQGLLTYADRADDVRVLRTELAKYATTLLGEQKKISTTISDWMDKNIDAYQQYLFLEWGIGFMRYAWGLTQDLYRQSAENDSFPWCKNERFTTPIYSLADPWLPGREDDGDLTGGFGEYLDCWEARACPANVDMSIFDEYFACIDQATEYELPDDVCQQFFPLPPKFPQLPDIEHQPDLILDFTAFAGVNRSVKIPVLKPTQIRLDYTQLRPPPLTQIDEPRYPDLPPLPSFDSRIAGFINATLPRVVLPHEDVDLDRLTPPPILSWDSAPANNFPSIKMPTVDLLSLLEFMIDTYMMLFWMTSEYDTFWQSLVKEGVEGGTEQDCIRPGNDPKGKCVHFEADLRERFQRIGSRPAIFLKDDLRALGQFRDPLVHGQKYCEQADWACHLHNAQTRLQREGWTTKLTDEYDTEQLLDELRNAVRDNVQLHPLSEVDSSQVIDAYTVPTLQP